MELSIIENVRKLATPADNGDSPLKACQTNE